MLADITIYYMDIRCFGKGYEQFYQNAKAMGVEFVKGKVASITEDDEQNPVVRVEMIEEGPQIVERTHDMVVLSVGMLPGDDPQPVFHVPISNDGFITVTSPNSTPADTDRQGIFVAGTAGGPLDIVDSIITAGAAAIRAAAAMGPRASALCGPTNRWAA